MSLCTTCDGLGIWGAFMASSDFLVINCHYGYKHTNLLPLLQLCLSQGDFTAMMRVLDENLTEGQSKTPPKPTTTSPVTEPAPSGGETTTVAETTGNVCYCFVTLPHNMLFLIGPHIEKSILFTQIVFRVGNLNYVKLLSKG